MKLSPRCSMVIVLVILVFIYVLASLYLRLPHKPMFKLLNLNETLNRNTWHSLPHRLDGVTFERCKAYWSNKQKRSGKRSYTRTNMLENTAEIVPKAEEECGTFLSKRGYWTTEVTKEEEMFPIAFSILVYKDLDQLERLLRAIYRPNNIYCIHADAKSSKDFRNALKKIVTCLPNVFLCSKSVHVYWGMNSVVQAELNCWKELLQSKVVWKYLINLTGHEYPLKSNAELVKILEALKGTNNINGGREGAFNIWKHPNLKVGNHSFTPHNITVTKGSTHLAASRGYVQYALNDQKAKDWFQWCRDVKIPDELCFSTLNHNPHLKVPGGFIGSPLKKPKDWWMMRFKKWFYTDTDYKCYGKYIREVCNIALGDLYYVIQSKYLFVNKIVLQDEPLAYRCLEYWLRKPLNITYIDVSHFSKISSKRSFD